MFHTVTRESFFAAESADARKLNETTKVRFDSIYAKQQDKEYLKANAMPKVCKGMDYTAPVVARHEKESRHENAFVITNTCHSKETNQGYNRSYCGRFYCH